MVLAEDKGTLLQIRGSADGTKAHGAVEAVGNTDQEGPYGMKKPSSLLNTGNECAGFKGILCSIPVTHPYPATRHLVGQAGVAWICSVQLCHSQQPQRISCFSNPTGYLTLK